MSKNKSILILLMISIICISPIYGASSDWTMFQQDASHEGFLEEASDFVTNLWSFNMGSSIYSTPVIHGDNIYVVSNDGILKSIDMEDGSQDWSYNLGTKVTASPVIANNTLFVGGQDGSMYAYDIQNKNLKWQYDTSKPIESTASVNNGTVYFGSNNGIFITDENYKIIKRYNISI